LQFQASQLGLGTQWIDIKKKYIEANALCGDIIKVTPSSKVVGDFAQFMVSNNLSKQDVIDQATKLDFPSSVVEFFQGYLGQPYGGFPEPLRSNIIRGKEKIDGRPGIGMKPLDFSKIKAELTEKYGPHINDFDVSSYCMYPKVFDEFQGFIDKFGDLRWVTPFLDLARCLYTQCRAYPILPRQASYQRGNDHLDRERKDLDHQAACDWSPQH
jgi:pyruvate carboxylase